MATKITPKDFVEALKDWSILDVVEAVKAIEDEFGIKAAAAVAAVAAAPSGAAAEPEEEQTEFTVTLTAVGESKINVIKAVRELTQLGLKGGQGPRRCGTKARCWRTSARRTPTRRSRVSRKQERQPSSSKDRRARLPRATR